MKRFTHVLEMLLRLRQCCNHLALLPPDYLQDKVRPSPITDSLAYCTFFMYLTGASDM
jgi:SNF2 family DNA or RNA helicase